MYIIFIVYTQTKKTIYYFSYIYIKNGYISTIIFQISYNNINFKNKFLLKNIALDWNHYHFENITSLIQSIPKRACLFSLVNT